MELELTICAGLRCAKLYIHALLNWRSINQVAMVKRLGIHWIIYALRPRILYENALQTLQHLRMVFTPLSELPCVQPSTIIMITFIKSLLYHLVDIIYNILTFIAQ